MLRGQPKAVAPGLTRGPICFDHAAMRGGWVYIVTDKPYGTLYVGVTSDIRRRAREHRDGAADGFTKRYGLKRLVYTEAHDDIRQAIEREKRIKRWQRARKIDLIQSVDPDWANLYDTLA